MLEKVTKVGAFIAVAAGSLIFSGTASAETASKKEWKTPQVVGSAPVKEEPKSNEAKAPRPVGENPYSAKRIDATK